MGWMRTSQLLPPNARRGSSHTVLPCARSSATGTILLRTYAQNSASVTNASVDFPLSRLRTRSQFRNAGDGVPWLVALRSHAHALATREVEKEQVTDWSSLMVGRICLIPWLKNGNFHQRNWEFLKGKDGWFRYWVNGTFLPHVPAVFPVSGPVIHTPLSYTPTKPNNK